MAIFALNTKPDFLPTHRRVGWTMLFELAYTENDRFHAYRDVSDWQAANRWCMEQFGYLHPGWTGIEAWMVMAFRDEVAATAFRMRWG